MFELQKDNKGEDVLVYVKRYRYPFERGLWIEVCHETHKEAQKFVTANRQMGIQVEKDQQGFYRALVLKD